MQISIDHILRPFSLVSFDSQVSGSWCKTLGAENGVFSAVQMREKINFYANEVNIC